MMAMCTLYRVERCCDCNRCSSGSALRSLARCWDRFDVTIGAYAGVKGGLLIATAA